MGRKRDTRPITVRSWVHYRDTDEIVPMDSLPLEERQRIARILTDRCFAAAGFIKVEEPEGEEV